MSKKCKKNTYNSAPDLNSSFFSHHFSFLLFYVVLCSFSFYLRRLTGEERTKATSRKEIEDYAAERNTMKICSFQLRRFSQVKLWLTRFHRIMVCDFWLFIYLFEIMKPIIFIFCLSFLFSKNTFLGNTIFFALFSVYHSCLWYVFD